MAVDIVQELDARIPKMRTLNKHQTTRDLLDDLQQDLAGCMQKDRFRLANEANTLWRKLATDPERILARVESLAAAVAKSISQCQRRQDRLPTVQLDPSLPLFEKRDQIAEAIRNHPVVVISGETGSGKSTQLPLIALQLGLGVQGFIGHTQPRRIAARSVASRIASQMGCSLGSHVGFKIRFDDQSSDDTYIKLLTDGILLAETQTDRFFDAYQMILIDEAHERSLNIDFLIGRLKRILPRRPDLKVVVTSATIDTQRFAEHFQVDGALPVPIIDVEGRTWPVELRYRPVAEGEESGSGPVDHIVESTVNIFIEERGDILVFLPTENDIREVNRKLKGALGSNSSVDILPLYARLSMAQQNAIFETGNRRRIVLATNVAESSITVPGIRIVVDSGTARISRYAPRSKVQRLPIEAISQASAKQRAGRCGRIGPGICVRLYSEEDFDSRPKFTTPEIRRTNLASVILQTLALGLGEIAEFPFIDPPHADAIADGYRTLFEIGAIDAGRTLTPLGRWLAKLPLDPRIGRMIHAAADENCLHEILIIAAALEIQDPRLRPAEKQQAADERHQKFRHGKSDFMSWLKVWDFFHKLRQDLSRSKFRLACQDQFLSINLLHQWQEIHRQLLNVVRQSGLRVRQRQDDYGAIHRSLLAGLLSGIAYQADKHEYTGAGGIKFSLWPGSGIIKSRPKWIVAAEIVETSRRFGRTAAAIDPAWIEPLSEHLSKTQHVDPHWSKKAQSVMAYQNVTLFGLPIVVRRRVGYSRIDPELSRQLFIEMGLAEFDMRENFAFLEHNRQLLDEVEKLAAKARRREWVIDGKLLAGFYDQRLPDDCVDAVSLRRALKRDRQLDGYLRMQMHDLVADGEVEPAANDFPDSIQIGSMQLPVEYRFEPGQEFDGATVRIPKEGLGQIDDAQAGWLIPGLNQFRIVSMIKSLPKSIRRNLVPVPETAQRVAAIIKPEDGSFAAAVAKQLTLITGQRVAVDMFDLCRIDEHLFVNLQVVDEQGQLIAQSRNINELRIQFGGDSRSFVESEDSQWNQDRLTAWTWGELPTEIFVRRGATELAVFPAVVDLDDSVGLRLVDSREQAQHLTRFGMLRLYVIALKKKLKQQVNWLPDLDRHQLKLVSLVSTEQLKQGLMDLIACIAFLVGKQVPRTQQQFEGHINQSTERISVATLEVAKWLPRFADAVHAAQLARETMPADFAGVAADISRQINQLAGPGFLSSIDWEWLQHFPRYFAAMTIRSQKMTSAALATDQAHQIEIADYWSRYEQIHTGHIALAVHDPELDRLRWMIEEYRVSLFAQKLGTCFSVSAKRLDSQILKIKCL